VRKYVLKQFLYKIVQYLILIKAICFFKRLFMVKSKIVMRDKCGVVFMSAKSFCKCHTA